MINIRNKHVSFFLCLFLVYILHFDKSKVRTSKTWINYDYKLNYK
jgi:hypothetical protein